MTIVRLVGVYDADGTLRGEVAYWIGARLGRRQCSLCDVTHGVFAQKAAWRSCREALPVSFDTYHRDDQPDDVRRVAGDRAPVVLAETMSGLVMLLDSDAIAAADGDPGRLVEIIESRLGELSLSWP